MLGTRPELSVGYQASNNRQCWTEFQHEHAVQGFSRRQISLLYKHQSEQVVPTLCPGATPDKLPFYANPLNEFQKQYKEDHPNEKFSAGQLAQIYRKNKYEKHVRAELESSTLNAPLANSLRRQVEEMLIYISMMQELPAIRLEERIEWRHVAQQLEWEEGNYNRQLFVDTHSEVRKQGAQDAGILQEGHEIESSRLDLSLDDGKRIGSGGSGVVYAAVMDKQISVAVKVIDGVNTKSKKRFEQELVATMKASVHENVLRVFGYTDMSSDSGRQSYGIIMELMGGGDLAFALHRDESVILSEKERLQLLLQVIKAIEFIHSQDITHRDIKPQNVLLSTDYQTAKLADFGLAGFKNTSLSTKQTQTTTKESDASMVLGLTPAYAAPEVFEGKLSFRDQAWKKSDVFSFTVLLTEVLMQAQPWEFETPQFIMNSVTKHQQRPFEIEHLVVFDGKAGNGKLHSLVQDGWHQDPACRPTATEMRERLEKVIAAGESLIASAKPSGNVSPRGVDGV